MTTPAIVSYDSLKHDVEVRKLKKHEIKAKYGLPTTAATTRLLQEAGLKIRPTRGPVFQLVGKPTEETVSSPIYDGVMDVATPQMEGEINHSNNY